MTPSANTRRRALWSLLVLLVVALLAALIWLAGRFDISQEQSRLDGEAAAAANDIRVGLNRSLQDLNALQGGDPRSPTWSAEAGTLLREHREWLRVEVRDARLAVLAHTDTPYRSAPFARLGRAQAQADVAQACANALRLGQPAYSGSYFVPQLDGMGFEVIELCIAQERQGQSTAYLVVTYSLPELLATHVDKQFTRTQEVAFTEADGTRLAAFGAPQRGGRAFIAQRVLDLPGNRLVLRLNSWRTAPVWFPNVLTGVVAALALALLVVLQLLGRDMRRRLRVERDLAEALAFRKAMEDSLVTGLRARDNEGKISYVNPAFCRMVGFSADELLGQGLPAPYWPPENAVEFQQRQAGRLAGKNPPPREGSESIFMHKSGTRFPVWVIEAPLIDAKGNQTGWMSACLDIREQRRVEELSRASQERIQATARLAMVGEMASLLSHELNQPLAAIASYANGSLNLLKEGAAGNETSEIGVAIRRIAEQAERAGKVIKSVHDFVRRRDHLRESVAPRLLVEAVLPLVNLQARKLGVRVVVALHDGLPEVLCDRTMVEQVLLNLARNAMQAMQGNALGEADASELRIEARPASPSERSTKGWVEFCVADQGHGLTPDVAERMFTPFFTTKEEGMGLGLSLCRTVVEQHGSTLSFEPKLPRGTRFKFGLPTE